MRNTLIGNFNEFVNFTNVTSFANTEFLRSTLSAIKIPDSLLYLGNWSGDGVFGYTHLKEFDAKNAVRANNGTFAYCALLSEVKAKHLKNTTATFRNCPKLNRLILPSLTNNTNASIGNGGSMLQSSGVKMCDIGSNLVYLADYFDYGTSSCVVVIRSKSFTINKNAFRSSIRVYCTSEMYSYLTNSTNNARPGIVYEIGSEDWVSRYGSADPYANLTQEEYDYYYKDIVEQG